MAKTPSAWRIPSQMNQVPPDALAPIAAWFDAEKFPTITFKSTSVAQTSPNTAKVTGDLTFHGVTKPDIEVGIGKGQLKVSEKLLDPLRKAAIA